MAYSGGAVALLSLLPRRMTAGPTLVSRLTGWVEDVRRAPIFRDPSFTLAEIRLKIPPFDGTSFCVDRSLVMLCGSEFVLVLREMMGPGSGSITGRVEVSESLPRIRSGDGCIELLVVSTPDSGDMMGEICCGLEAIEELVMAEEGAVEI